MGCLASVTLIPSVKLAVPACVDGDLFLMHEVGWTPHEGDTGEAGREAPRSEGYLKSWD